MIALVAQAQEVPAEARERLSRLIQQALDKGMTPETLAEELGVSRSLVSRWHGRSRFPGRDRLARVADYFKVKVGYLLAREATEERRSPPPMGPEPAVIVSLGERIAETRGHLEEVAAWLGRYVTKEERRRWEDLRKDVRSARRAANGRTRQGSG